MGSPSKPIPQNELDQRKEDVPKDSMFDFSSDPNSSKVVNPVVPASQPASDFFSFDAFAAPPETVN